MHRFAFVLPCLLEKKAVACYGLLCMVLLCFVRGKEAVACHGLRFVRGRGKLSHVTVCFVVLGIGLFCFANAAGKLSHVTVCFALLCFASFCTALLCFALHCSFVK